MRPPNWITYKIDNLRLERFNGFAACKRDERNLWPSGALVEVVTGDQFAIRRDRRRKRYSALEILVDVATVSEVINDDWPDVPLSVAGSLFAGAVFVCGS